VSRATKTLAVEVEARRALVTSTPVLGALAARLAQQLDPLRLGTPYFPERKALLARDGGICAVDGARLIFDPLSPERHTCPRCGAVYTGERHHGAWVMRYQIWLSERAVHAALLAAMGLDGGAAGVALAILDGYAERYRDYPNRDNVLGPSRLFFSTYLESIWLTQIAWAAALLETCGAVDFPLAQRDMVREMVRESRALIAEFDEGLSNRQTWNQTAILAASMLLGERRAARAAARGARGLLMRGVGEDGLWHEGENYHLFALRGFLHAAEWARMLDDDLYLETLLGRMYVAPLPTLLPDLTLPARGDAPYGVSIRQPRFAELWEIGRVRAPHRAIDAVLGALYAEDLPDGEDSGFADLAEQEIQHPPARQRRDRLGWKALLWMRGDDPPAESLTLRRIAPLDGRGAVVLRPDAQRYASVEYGVHAGGHGHPDLLHLTLFDGRHVFADFGTGSYVSPSLHWYRATLAHTAVGAAGVGQGDAVAYCIAADEQGAWSWCRVRADGVCGARTVCTRSVLLGPGLVIDVMDVAAPETTVVDLALHPLAGLGVRVPAAAPTLPAEPGAGHETGYGIRAEPWSAAMPPAIALGGHLELATAPRLGESLYVAEAPGPPGTDFADGEPLTFLVRRAAGEGRWVHVIHGPEARVRRVDLDGRRVVVTLIDGSDVVVRAGGDGAIVEHAGERIALAGLRGVPRFRGAPRDEPAFRVVCPLAEAPPPLDALPEDAPFVLERAQYRRAEESYETTRDFSARAWITAVGGTVVFTVAVRKRELIVRPPDAADPGLDNEAADIHSDGVQCYVGRDRWEGYVAVPELGGETARVRAVAGTAGDADRVRATWRQTPTGYAMRIVCDTGRAFGPGDHFRFDLVVNEMQRGRARRAGQLALRGGGWVYLRGDREPAFGAPEATVR